MGFWSNVYPQDMPTAQSQVDEGATAPGSPVVATPGGTSSSAPTVSLLVIVGVLFALRLLVDRGVSPGA